MKINHFSQPHHFFESQHNLDSLAAFALGAQHHSIQTLLCQDGAIPTSLQCQYELESAAKYYWDKAQYNPRLMLSVLRYSKALLESRDTMFEDISLHLAYPELPLIKYYAALLKAKNEIDRDQIWCRHLTYCRALCLALYEHSRAPNAELSYNANAVMLNNAKDKQCFYFTGNAAPQCFHLKAWRYFLLPMPWEATNREASRL
ncbi:hypothetical protein [Thaumasiovibrio sp. DFM-14]|uniref:hypothetical protein n=1 Tax=Thaumasiovibrio sp. DFM-14 TaxID=3384792 RepID=UPI0039A26CF7